MHSEIRIQLLGLFCEDDIDMFKCILSDNINYFTSLNDW